MVTQVAAGLGLRHWSFGIPEGYDASEELIAGSPALDSGCERLTVTEVQPNPAIPFETVPGVRVLLSPRRLSMR